MWKPFHESDKALLIDAHVADPWHAPEDQPEFYWERGTITTRHDDAEGCVFFMRWSGIRHESVCAEKRILRLDIQFLPVEKRRIALLMTFTWPHVRHMAEQCLASEIEFYSRNPELQAWTAKHLGFTADPARNDRMVCAL